MSGYQFEQPKTIHIRFPKVKLDLINVAAKRHNLTVAEYIRFSVMKNLKDEGLLENTTNPRTHDVDALLRRAAGCRETSVHTPEHNE